MALGQPKDTTAVAADTPETTLANLGYKAELTVNRTTFHVAFMAFVLASIPWGLSTTITYPIVGGGPVNIIWGWILVSFFILCIASSLGEITSVYPTAGGVYYQAFMLAPHRWKHIAGWVCGWLYLVGNLTITLSVTFGATTFIIACINVFETESGDPVFGAEAYKTFLFFVGIVLLCTAISAFGNKWLPLLDGVALFGTLAGVTALIIVILVIAKNGRRDANWVFTHFETNTGWPKGWSFCVGLLHAAYGTSSTGMIISMCEEVQRPAVQVPKAMIATVIINLSAGLLFLVPLMFVSPDMIDLVGNPQPVPYIVKSAVGSPAGSFVVLLPLVILAILCGVACTTASSRCVWAFARDGAIPGAGMWVRLHHRLGVPLNAMMLGTVVQIALGLLYFGSSEAFSAFSGVGVICLASSYATPIALSLATGRKAVSSAAFPLGKLGLVANVLAIAWSVLSVPLFCMPTSIPVSTATVNYAPAVFVAAILLSAAWYAIWGKRNYAGPHIL